MMDVVDARNITLRVVPNALMLYGINYALLTRRTYLARRNMMQGQIDSEVRDLRRI